MSAKRKKIVILGPAPPYRGGNAMFIAYLYNALLENYDVVLLNYSLLYPSFLFPGATQFDLSKKSVKNVKSERIINSINPFNWLQVARRIRREQADLVVFDWWNPFFGPCHRVISSLIKRRYSGKILFLTENFISHEARTIDRLLTRIGLCNASCFMALSDTVERELSALAAGRKIYRSELPMFDYSLAGSGFDRSAERKRLGLTDNDDVLLFFGYVRKYKGLDILLEAMPEIVRRVPRAKLVVAGEFYDDKVAYESIVSSNGTAGIVQFWDKFIPNEDVGRFFAAADVVVQPYRSATQSGILNTSYSFGVPAVVTRVGGLEQYVDDGITGIVSGPESPEEIAAGVERFFILKQSTDFAANIRARVSRSGFNNIASVFEEILRDCED
ncbi:glycosyltransferase family 4 protein [Ignavibacteria bacterium]|nr:glycosyltransferase [Bacteroidota bacterium]